MNRKAPWFLALLIAAIGSGAEGAESTAQFFPLGFLTPTAEISAAYDVSSDGSVVVGGSRLAPTGNEWAGFRWTEATGLVPLAGAPPFSSVGIARAVSDDGTVIIAGEQRWTEAGLTLLDGMTGLGVSGDGSLVVGFGLRRQMDPIVPICRDFFRSRIPSIHCTDASLRW